MNKQLCDDTLEYTCIHYTQFTLLFNYQKGRGRRRGEEEVMMALTHYSSLYQKSSTVSITKRFLAINTIAKVRYVALLSCRISLVPRPREARAGGARSAEFAVRDLSRGFLVRQGGVVYECQLSKGGE